MFQFIQGWLIFPGSQTQGRITARVRPDADSELVRLGTAGGEQVAALFGPALTPQGLAHPQAKRRPTIIYFYGNGMCLADTAEAFRALRQQLQANVLIPEFVGYGMSSGRASEQGCYETADAAYDHLLKRTDVDAWQIIPMGWSLGAAVAIDLASRRPVAGLATFSAFTSMLDMADTLLPYLPNSLLLQHRFENERKLRGITCPVFLAHGRRDTLIPYRMCERLIKARGDRPTACFTAQRADHHDILYTGGEDLFGALRRFVESLSTNGP